MGLSIKHLAETLQSAADWAKWEVDSLEDFHAYAHTFGARPGENVYHFVLRDALARRSLTLEQFRANWKEQTP